MTDTLMRPTRIDGLRLVFGDENCISCDNDDYPGQQIGWGVMPCDKCKGTGRRGNGRCRNCRDSYDGTPPGQVRDYSNRFPVGPCGQCDGKRFVPAQWHSHLDADVLAAAVDAIGVRVTLRGQDMGRAEQAIGVIPVSGGMFTWMSVVDYGRTMDRLRKAGAARDGDTEESRMDRVKAEIEVWRLELVDKLKRETATQASKLCTRDGVLAAEIVVSLANNGYSVFAMPRSEDERAAILAATSPERAA